MNDYRLASSVGRPQDNCLALARLIVRGIFEQFPTLKLVVTHLGGGICEVIGRMNYAYTLQEEAFFLGSYEPMLIKHPPLHYLKMCYLDSVCYHLPAARCVVETVGADKVVFGTDAPPLTADQGRRHPDGARPEARARRRGEGVFRQREEAAEDRVSRCAQTAAARAIAGAGL